MSGYRMGWQPFTGRVLNARLERPQRTREALAIHLREARRALLGAAGKADGLADAELHRDTLALISAVDDLAEKAE